MIDYRHMSATRFFTETVLIAVGMCAVTLIVGYMQGTDLSLWWLLLAFPFFFGLGYAAMVLSGAVMVETDKKQDDLNAYPDQCPPANEVTLLTLGMDEHGHKLRLLVDGKQKWVRVGFKDVKSMFQGQEMMERLRQRDAQSNSSRDKAN